MENQESFEVKEEVLNKITKLENKYLEMKKRI
jgi:hypothetical protein